MSDMEQFILNKLEKLDEKLDTVRDSNAALKTAFENHIVNDEKMMDTLYTSLEKLNDGLDQHAVLLKEYNRQLEIHMKRTELLESQLLPIVLEKNEQITVNRWRSQKLRRIIKMASYITVLAGAAAGVIKLLSMLSVF